uniref:Uncharacterized protein n=1 Tax=Arundo donax TaxID=35708 RepID=A0A0A9H8N2_ARUDO
MVSSRPRHTTPQSTRSHSQVCPHAVKKSHRKQFLEPGLSWDHWLAPSHPNRQGSRSYDLDTSCKIV